MQAVVSVDGTTLRVTVAGIQPRIAQLWPRLAGRLGRVGFGTRRSSAQICEAGMRFKNTLMILETLSLY